MSISYKRFLSTRNRVKALHFSPISFDQDNNIIPSMGSLRPIDNSSIPNVPQLAHNLDEILFKPGFHFMKDYKTNTLKHAPFIYKITQPKDFSYERLSPFIPPSKDQHLHELAGLHSKKYIASTSSISSVLSHLYFLISKWKAFDITNFSEQFNSQPKGFTRGSLYPPSILLQPKNGVYSIDADKSFDKSGNILMNLGKSLEKLLSSDEEEYNTFIKNSLIEPKEHTSECYHYSGYENFLLRSQLDCRHPNLKKQTFDLKTRAVISIRHDIDNYKESCGYQILKQKGILESFEREYFDMMRSAFLKYNFQARIGNMNGIFVAYHNTARLLGFQYISIKEMDKRLFGNSLTGLYHFNAVMSILGRLLDYFTFKFSNKTLLLSFEYLKNADTINLWVEVKNGKSSSDLNKSGKLTKPINSSKPSANSINSLSFSDTILTDIPIIEKDDSSNNQKTNAASKPPLLKDTPYIVDHNSDIYKYTIEANNILNDEEIYSNVFLSSILDNWQLNWRISEHELPYDIIYQEYTKFRNNQRKYFSPKLNQDGEIVTSSYVQNLREISKKRMHLNDFRGQIVVTSPNSGSIWNLGEMCTIAWELQGKVSNKVSFDIELIEGQNPIAMQKVAEVAKAVPASVQQYTFQLDKNIKISSFFSVKMLGSDGKDYYSNVFKIDAKPQSKNATDTQTVKASSNGETDLDSGPAEPRKTPEMGQPSDNKPGSNIKDTSGFSLPKSGFSENGVNLRPGQNHSSTFSASNVTNSIKNGTTDIFSESSSLGPSGLASASQPENSLLYIQYCAIIFFSSILAVF
ncbi:hypothetical protein BB561_004920 [Smittium simulii]|uniref:Yeast cell wall synthesis Kre9/Knh1-like N-terminal domain-containing protein n=1 Tax=Smittium simulii TaxID=133385 RepID=A0A2T9YDC0_9FUNG|nr:hypothetical protein BB561_004920 [Smittium simulii]